MANTSEKKESIVVLDYGSQYSMLIVRRIREAGVYSELIAWDASPETFAHLDVKGFVLSGGPASVYDSDAPSLPSYLIDSDLPVLGICYGMQLLANQFGGEVSSADEREYGSAIISQSGPQHPLFDGLPSSFEVWASHGDNVLKLPDGFRVLAESENAPIVAFTDDTNRFGIQFHPEVVHTTGGTQLLHTFLIEILECLSLIHI